MGLVEVVVGGLSQVKYEATSRGEMILGKKEHRKKALDERISAAIRGEFAGLIAELERDLREYRDRLRLKAETRSALEKAEAEVRRLHFDRIELKKRFWEAYYGEGEAA